MNLINYGKLKKINKEGNIKKKLNFMKLKPIKNNINNINNFQEIEKEDKGESNDCSKKEAAHLNNENLIYS